MPLLGDIYSYIDALKRKAQDTVSNPVNSLNQFIGNIGDQKNQNNALMSQAGYGLLGKPTVSVLAPQQGPSIGYGSQTSVTPQQQALARGLLAEQGTNTAMAGATVWHGSPHKFDKFDASKIGTGEGAQAYGHGLYLAESPGVAQSYRDTLSKQQDSLGSISNSATSDTVKNLLAEAGGDRNKAVQIVKDRMGHGTWGNSMGADHIAQTNEIVDSLLNPPGSLYKVDLPDEHIGKMLDWDSPFSQQPQNVKDALAKLDPESYHPQGSDFDANELGQQTYQRLVRTYGDTKVPAMMQGGMNIPGIRYLDGDSRANGIGSSNFVVFPGNEGLLNILERNGQPVNQLSGLLQP